MRQIRRQSKSIAALALLIAITTYSLSSFTQAATLRKQECSYECQYNTNVNTGGLSTVRECCDKHTPSEGGRCSVNDIGNVCKCSIDKACYVDTRCEHGGDWPNNCIKKISSSPHKQECSYECQYSEDANTGGLQTVRDCCDKHTPSGGDRCSVNEEGNVCQCSVDKACYVDTRCDYGGYWPDNCNGKSTTDVDKDEDDSRASNHMKTKDIMLEISSNSTDEQKQQGIKTIYIFRHAENKRDCNEDKTDCEEWLSPKGKKRVDRVINYMKKNDIIDKITHVFASHLPRSYLTVLPIAELAGVNVTTFPKDAPYSVNQTESVCLTLEAVRVAPMNSTIVISGHGATVYKILSTGDDDKCDGLGLDTSNNQTIFPKDDEDTLPENDIGYSNLWKVIIDAVEKVTLDEHVLVLI